MTIKDTINIPIFLLTWLSSISVKGWMLIRSNDKQSWGWKGSYCPEKAFYKTKGQVLENYYFEHSNESKN